MDLFIEIFQMYNEIKISDKKEKILPKNKKEVKSKNKEKFKNNKVNFELLNPIN